MDESRRPVKKAEYDIKYLKNLDKAQTNAEIVEEENRARSGHGGRRRTATRKRQELDSGSSATGENERASVHD